MPNDEPTLFQRIAAREIPADIVFEDDALVAFRDIAPKAPVHLLVVPRHPYRDVGELAAADPALLAHVAEVAKALAAEHADGDFRLIFNSGPGAGQTVFHVHAHVLAGGLEEGSLGSEL
jgi:histidine triad (HIT) family protein